MASRPSSGGYQKVAKRAAGLRVSQKDEAAEEKTEDPREEATETPAQEAAEEKAEPADGDETPIQKATRRMKARK